MSGELVSEDGKSLARDLYDGEIAYLDNRLGQFFDTLRELGLYDDAVIVFVSDHGETLWDHDEFYGHAGVNQHAELTQVPLVVKPPAGDYRRGAVVETRVRAFDLMPTVLELAGIEYPQDEMDARSLMPFLVTEGAHEENDRPALSQSAGSAALWLDERKYIFPVGRGTDPGRRTTPVLDGEELYDLKRDPGELHNLAPESPQELDVLRREAFEYLLRTVGGRFLLVRSSPDLAEPRLSVTCDPSCSWDPLLQFGLERTGADPPGTDVFEGRGLGDGVVLFARFSGPTDIKMRVYIADGAAQTATRDVVRYSLTEATSFSADVFTDQWSRRRESGAWILQAPDRVSADETAAPAMDAQQEKALRALGYLR